MEPCGIEAIIAACNEAFGVETCKCIQHSDGGCPLPAPDIVEAAGNAAEAMIDTTATAAPSDAPSDTPSDAPSDTPSEAPSDAPSLSEETDGESGMGVHAIASSLGGVEISSGTVPPSASPGATEPEEELVAAELGADGRRLQDNRQAITTDLEIKFITDVEVRTER